MKNHYLSTWLLAAASAFGAMAGYAQDKVTIEAPEGDNICLLGSLDLTKITCFDDNGKTKVLSGKSTAGNDIMIRDTVYVAGVGTHAPSVACIRLNGATSFKAKLGIDDEADQKAEHGIVDYVITGYKADDKTGTELKKGTITRDDEGAVTINLDVKEYAYLKLDLQTGAQPWADHADWANAYFEYVGEKPETILESEIGAGSGSVDDGTVKLPATGREGEEIVPLSSLEIGLATCGWGEIQANKSIDKNPLTLRGTVYESGVGTHASSTIIVKLNGSVTHFVGRVGIDDEVGNGGDGVDYRVVLRNEKGEEKVMYSGTIRRSDATIPEFDVDCNGWKYLILDADKKGDDGYDHVDWANAYFEYVEQNSTKPQIVSAKELASKLDCANIVYSQPGVRFMQKFRPYDDATVSVSGLPEGLTWNAERNLVEGIVTEEGVYTYDATVAYGEETETKTITLNVTKEMDQPVPFMGWLSWNVVQGEISQSVIETVADAMVNSGLADAGYNYLVIDDLWHAGSRSADGKPVEDPAKFPNGMKVCADYVHDKGLKFGIYSDAGNKTCAGKFGSFGYEEIDAKQYAEWDVDLLKYDYCFAPDDLETARERYKKMGDALKASGRNILLYMCEWGVREPWKWGAETGATTWRCTYDTRDGWVGVGQGIGVTQSVRDMRDLWPYSGVNRFNDADMMCVGIHGTGKSSNDLVQGKAGMTQTEYQTQFSMWCMWASPLTLSFDLRKPISDDDMRIMANKEMIAINQDRMGQQAEFIGETDGVQIYMKDLENGDVAVAVLNMNSTAKNATIDFSKLSALKAGQAYYMRDLWAGETLSGTYTDSYSVKVAGHETKVYRFSENEITGIDAATANDNADVRVNVGKKSVKLDLPGAKGASKRVLISDLSGRIVASATTGATTVELPMNAAAGTYVANVVCHGRSQSVKFVF